MGGKFSLSFQFTWSFSLVPLEREAQSRALYLKSVKVTIVYAWTRTAQYSLSGDGLKEQRSLIGKRLYLGSFVRFSLFK